MIYALTKTRVWVGEEVGLRRRGMAKQEQERKIRRMIATSQQEKMSLRKTNIRGRKKGRSRKRRSSRRVMGEEGKDYEEEEEEDGEKDEDRQQQPKQRGKGGAGEKRTGDQRMKRAGCCCSCCWCPCSLPSCCSFH